MKFHRAALTLLLLLPLGCGTGESTEEATDNCQRQRQAQASCFDDAAFDSCVSCREECGRDCITAESCPLQFSCP
jgi:hypothetical protein